MPWRIDPTDDPDGVSRETRVLAVVIAVLAALGLALGWRV